MEISYPCDESDGTPGDWLLSVNLRDVLAEGANYAGNEQLPALLAVHLLSTWAMLKPAELPDANLRSSTTACTGATALVAVA